jgi:hypothetical protein
MQRIMVEIAAAGFGGEVKTYGALSRTQCRLSPANACCVTPGRAGTQVIDCADGGCDGACADAVRVIGGWQAASAATKARATNLRMDGLLWGEEGRGLILEVTLEELLDHAIQFF